MIQTTFTWNDYQGSWQVKERHWVDTMPALDPDTVAENATDFDVHEAIRVEITQLHSILAAVETYRRCMACQPDHAPVLTSAFAWGDTTALGDVITARQAGETWGVSPSRARHILANVASIGLDQMTGAKLYPSDLAENARRTQMVGQGRRTDLERQPRTIGTLHEIYDAHTLWECAMHKVGGDPDHEFDHDAVGELYRSLVNKALDKYGIVLGSDNVFRGITDGDDARMLIRDTLAQVSIPSITAEFDSRHWPKR